MKVAVCTDSNSGITQSEAATLGVSVLPMPFVMDGKTYFEDIDLSQEEFYAHLQSGAEISTSQPAMGDVTDRWDKLLAEYDEVVHIPMSSGLSASCQTALMLAENYGGRVAVVNNQRISVTQRQSVLDAMELADMGFSAAQIKECLEEEKFESSIYITVDTLKYLKKGGRVTPAAAAIGTVLQIKPVLQIQGERLDAFSKARGMKQAKKIMIDAIRSDLEGRFAGTNTPDSMHLAMAYTFDAAAAADFKREVEAAFPGFDIVLNPLSLSVSCHIGPGALAVTCSRKVDAAKYAERFGVAAN